MNRKFKLLPAICLSLLAGMPIQALADGVQVKPFFSVSRGDTHPLFEEVEALRQNASSGGGLMKVSPGDTHPVHEEAEALRQNASSDIFHVTLRKAFGLGKALQASLLGSVGPQNSMVSTRSIKRAVDNGSGAISSSVQISGSNALSAR